MPPDTAPRLTEAVDLCLPAAHLERAILQWACQQGEGAVFSMDQLTSMRSRLDANPAKSSTRRHLMMDIDLALGVYSARLRQPSGGFSAYADAWEELVLAKGLHLTNGMDQLRSLHETFGGMLLNGRAAPFVLLIPCEDGTWVQMGWDRMTHLAGSPLSDRPPQVLEARDGFTSEQRAGG